MNDAGRIGFVFKGSYDPAAAYDFLDVVYFGHSTYTAKKLTIGNEPADDNEYWQVLAKAPANSVTGIKGAKETIFRTGDVNLTPANIGALPSDGTAVSAGKLNTNAGSAVKPVYFANGVPAACTYELNKTVPANAELTDTRVTKATFFRGDKTIPKNGTSYIQIDATYLNTLSIYDITIVYTNFGILFLYGDNINNFVTLGVQSLENYIGYVTFKILYDMDYNRMKFSNCYSDRKSVV